LLTLTHEQFFDSEGRGDSHQNGWANALDRDGKAFRVLNEHWHGTAQNRNRATNG